MTIDTSSEYEVWLVDPTGEQPEECVCKRGMLCAAQGWVLGWSSGDDLGLRAEIRDTEGNVIPFDVASEQAKETLAERMTELLAGLAVVEYRAGDEYDWQPIDFDGEPMILTTDVSKGMDLRKGDIGPQLVKDVRRIAKYFSTLADKCAKRLESSGRAFVPEAGKDGAA